LYKLGRNSQSLLTRNDVSIAVLYQLLAAKVMTSHEIPQVALARELALNSNVIAEVDLRLARLLGDVLLPT
jgi:hypothetical protein